jgi:hypothetical protein
MKTNGGGKWNKSQPRKFLQGIVKYKLSVTTLQIPVK